MSPTSSSLAHGDRVLTPPGSLWLTPSSSAGRLSGGRPLTDALDVLSRAHLLLRRMVSTFQNSLIILRLPGY